MASSSADAHITIGFHSLLLNIYIFKACATGHRIRTDVRISVNLYHWRVFYICILLALQMLPFEMCVLCSFGMPSWYPYVRITSGAPKNYICLPDARASSRVAHPANFLIRATGRVCLAWCRGVVFSSHYVYDIVRIGRSWDVRFVGIAVRFVRVSIRLNAFNLWMFGGFFSWGFGTFYAFE